MCPRTVKTPLSAAIAAAFVLASASPLAEAFTLELLHAADQEAGIPAIVDAPNFSAVLRALKEQDLGNDGVPDNTIVLSSGDAIIPGVFFDTSEEVFGGAGFADIEIQNLLGFQAISFGNHEFDKGTELLATLIAGDGSSFVGSDFPYLSANLDFSTDANLAPLVVDDAMAPMPNSIAASTVIDVNGELIGVVGATTPTIDVISSPGDVTIVPTDFDGTPTPAQLDALAAEIQADIDTLLGANPTVNKVILLAHMQQIAIEQALATRMQDVDIIVAGGSNTRLFDADDRPRDGDTALGPYPIFETDADGKPVAIVNTDGNYRYVGRLVIDFDADGVIDPSSYDPAVSGAYATDAQGVTDVEAEGLQDPNIQAIVDELAARIEELEGNVFGVTEFFLNGTRGDVRTQETNLGNLTADANLAVARMFDPSVLVSLKNGGGIRDNIGFTIVPPGGTTDDLLKLPPEAVPGVKPEGGISQTAISNALRFNNGLTLLTVTAEELRAILEHGFAASGTTTDADGNVVYDLSNTQGRFPQLSGISVAWDPSLPANERIVSAAIVDGAGKAIDVLVAKGELVGNPGRQLRMVTLSFLAGGGDGYPFPDGPAANIVQLELEETAPRTGVATFAPDGSEQDALAEYLDANFPGPDFGPSYTEQDLGIADDERIQNLLFRGDSVIPLASRSAQCSEDGWKHVFRENGSAFNSRTACTRYATQQRAREVRERVAEQRRDLRARLKEQRAALRERLADLRRKLRED